jgi:single-stranded DNA-binding protein
MLDRFNTQIIGRVGQLETRTHEEKMFASLSVAIDQSYKRAEEWVDKTTWVPVEIKRDATAKFISEHIKVGDLVIIDGHGESRSFVGADGKDRTILEVVIAGPGESINKISSPKPKET